MEFVSPKQIYIWKVQKDFTIYCTDRRFPERTIHDEVRLKHLY